MKRILLGCVLAIATLSMQAQIITYVAEPAALEANLTFTWADPPDWGTADLNIPANSIMDTLAIALDALGDSTICDAGGVVSDVNGKIAVLWRGGCGFGTKALAAQNAGAVGVVIINQTGAPVGMGAGADGASVTIPTVMISTSDGQAIFDAIQAGTDVVFFIGNKQGLFADDLGIFAIDILMPPATGKHMLVASDATEFNSLVGAWVRNFGSNDATGVLLNCEVTDAGGTVYNETSSTPVTIISGDSAFIQLPDFALSSYSGFYEMTYTALGDSTDLFPGDDSFGTNFMIDDFFSNGLIDPVDGLPDNQQFFRLANQTGGLSTCLHFQDPNASRLRADGVFGAASTAATDSLPGQILFSQVWQWDDVFVDLNDMDLAFNAVTLLEEGEFIYTTDDQNARVWIPFNNPVGLEDNTRYIFCVASIDDRMFLGHEGTIDYEENRINAVVTSPQPINVQFDAGMGTWSAVGFGTDVVPSIAVQMAANDISVNDIEELTSSPAYPNPAVNMVRIPLKNATTSGNVEIFDAQGRLVSSQPVQFNGGTLEVDMSNIGNGAYTFKLINQEGGVQSFQIVVSK